MSHPLKTKFNNNLIHRKFILIIKLYANFQEDISLQRAHDADSSRSATADSPFNSIASFYEGIHVQELMDEMSYDVDVDGIEEEKEEGEYVDEADQVMKRKVRNFVSGH